MAGVRGEPVAHKAQRFDMPMPLGGTQGRLVRDHHGEVCGGRKEPFQGMWSDAIRLGVPSHDGVYDPGLE